MSVQCTAEVPLVCSLLYVTSKVLLSNSYILFLTVIHEDTFKHNKNLETVSLSDNNIRAIDVQLFRSNENLLWIRLVVRVFQNAKSEKLTFFWTKSHEI